MGPAGAEDGGIVTGWLLQLVLILAVVSLVVYEIVAIAVVHVSLDDTSREIARVTRDAYRDGRSLVAAQDAAEDALEEERAEVMAVDEVDGELVITMSERARTLLLHRVPPLRDLATATTTRRVEWRP